MESIKKFKAKADREIELYMDRVIDEARERDEFITLALQYVKKFLLSGGKRIRPALMYYGYLAAGGNDKEKMLKTSISVELIHAFLLIHDDIMDKGMKRHGIDTVHVHFSDLGKKYFPDCDYKHFGDSMAVIIGDMVAAMGNQIIYESTFDPKLVTRALSRLQSIVSMTVIGQSKDMYIEYQKKASEKEVMEMYEYKTAKYTFEGPLHLGVILGGGDDKMAKTMSDYSIPLGIAFQIQDDILGVFGSEEKVGKDIGSDIREGKQTILVARAIENGSDKQKKRIKELLGKSDLSVQEVEDFRRIIEETGSLDYARKIAKENTIKGKDAIEKDDIHGEAKAFLLEIADHLLNREV